MTGPCIELPRYRCHKEVWALRIKSIDRGSVTLLHFQDPAYAPLSVSYDYDVKHSPEAGGYYVIYKDGYQSYSPAEAFEDGYTRLPSDHRDRVRAERAELAARIEKLGAFFGTEPFSSLAHDERERLHAQMAAMADYEAVLSDRIAAFPA